MDLKIVWTTEQRRLGDLVDWPKNPRRLSPHDAKALRESLERFDLADPLIVNVDGRIIGGHQRKRVMLASQEWDPDALVDVRVPSRLLTEGEVAELNVRLNRVGEWDWEILASDFNADDLLEWGFNEDELLRQGWLKSESTEDPEPQLDKAAELQEKWDTSLGQVWQLNEHRLAVGDCMDWAVVDAVMQGEKANGVFTSPPYAMQRKNQYGGVPVDQYVSWWQHVQANIKAVLAEDGSFFVNIKAHTEHGERVLYVMDLVLAMQRQWGWKFIDELIWYKTGFPGAFNNRFMNQFEPVFWFGTDGGANLYFQTVTPSEFTCSPFIEETESILHFAEITRVKFRPKDVCHPGIVNRYVGGRQLNPVSKNIDFMENRQKGMARPGNVIKVHVNNEALAHAAIFPVGLPTFFIKAFSDEGDIWLDPFIGSGTTMIAAERVGRLCRGIELDPKSCAVTLQRWIDLTGCEPRLLQG